MRPPLIDEWQKVPEVWDVVRRAVDADPNGGQFQLARAVEDHDVTHLHWLRERLGGQQLDAVVISTGPEAYRGPDGIGVVPLALLAL